MERAAEHGIMCKVPFSKLLHKLKSITSSEVVYFFFACFDWLIKRNIRGSRFPNLEPGRNFEVEVEIFVIRGVTLLVGQASPPGAAGGGLLLGRKERGPHSCSVCPAFAMRCTE